MDELKELLETIIKQNELIIEQNAYLTRVAYSQKFFNNDAKSHWIFNEDTFNGLQEKTTNVLKLTQDNK